MERRPTESEGKAMTDEQINELVATKIMGWTHEPRDVGRAVFWAGWRDASGGFTKQCDWFPSENWNHAMQAAEAWCQQGNGTRLVDVLLRLDGRYEAEAVIMAGEQVSFVVEDASGPRAICLALLQAAGVPVDDETDKENE